MGTFTESFTWNDLGLPATVTYPQLAGVGPARTVTYDVTNGALTRVHEGATDPALPVGNTVTHRERRCAASARRTTEAYR